MISIIESIGNLAKSEKIFSKFDLFTITLQIYSIELIK